MMNEADNNYTKFQLTRFGLKSDPRGAHVTMAWQGRTLLGEVTGLYRNETRGMMQLTVKHFDGTPWPLNPHVLAVDVLVREYEEVSE
jgi:hypothetical protein